MEYSDAVQPVLLGEALYYSEYVCEYNVALVDQWTGWAGRRECVLFIGSKCVTELLDCEHA